MPRRRAVPERDVPVAVLTGDRMRRQLVPSLLAEAKAHRASGRPVEEQRALGEALHHLVDLRDLDGGHVPAPQVADIKETLDRWFALGIAMPPQPLEGPTQALKLLTAKLPPWQLAAWRHVLVLALHIRGEASTAELHRAVEDYVRTASLPLVRADAEAWHASHLEWVGLGKLALEAGERARRLLPEAPADGPDPAHEVRLFVDQTTAHVLFSNGQHEEAARLYLALAPRYGDRAGPLYVNAASALIEARRLEEAASLLDHARAAGGVQPYAADIAGVHAQLLLAGGQLEECLEAVSTAQQLLAGQERPDLAWQLNHTRARALSRLQRPAEALDAYEAAAAAVLVTRSAPRGYAADSADLRDKRPVFEEAAVAAAELGEAVRCLQLVEQVKARSLTVLMTVRDRLTWRHLGRPPEVARLQAAIDALDRGLQFAEGEAYVELQDRRRGVYARLQGVLDELRRDASSGFLLRNPLPLDVGLLQASLADRGQAVVSLFLAGETIVAVLIDGSGCVVGSTSMSEPIRSALAGYAANLTSPHPVPALFDPARWRITADDLVPAQLLERALDAESVAISPNGIMHALPWPALPFGGRRLFERCPVGLLPNVSAALLTEQPVTPPTGVRVIGLPGGARQADLAGVAAELRDLTLLYSNFPAPLTGHEPLQSVLLDLLSADDDVTLHVACHGRADPDLPMASGLIVRDGVVDAGEMLTRGVRRREVVLSACSTGWRPHRVGELDLLGDDVLGLPGALLEGGVSALLLSITPAADEPMRRLTVGYHRERLAGLPPLHALAAAQRERLSSNDPVWGWCGTVLYGCR